MTANYKITYINAIDVDDTNIYKMSISCKKVKSDQEARSYFNKHYNSAGNWSIVEIEKQYISHSKEKIDFDKYQMGGN